MNSLTDSQLRAVQKTIIGIATYFALDRIHKQMRGKIEDHFQTQRGMEYRSFGTNAMMGLYLVFTVVAVQFIVFIILGFIIFIFRQRACADKLTKAAIDAGVAAAPGAIAAAAAAKSGGPPAAPAIDPKDTQKAVSAVSDAAGDYAKEFMIAVKLIGSVFFFLFNERFIQWAVLAFTFSVVQYIFFKIYINASKLKHNMDNIEVVKSLQRHYIFVYGVIVYGLLFALP